MRRHARTGQSLAGKKHVWISTATQPLELLGQGSGQKAMHVPRLGPIDPPRQDGFL